MIGRGRMRILLALALLLPSACGEGGDRAAIAADDRIDCRIGAALEYEHFCRIEQSAGERGRALTIRKPDGGFRRLLVADDGRGVVAADGAEQATVTIIDDGRIEVAIGGDSFRLPATVRR